VFMHHNRIDPDDGYGVTLGPEAGCRRTRTSSTAHVHRPSEQTDLLVAAAAVKIFCVGMGAAEAAEATDLIFLTGSVGQQQARAAILVFRDDPCRTTTRLLLEESR
jgi:hypothetical protein